MKKIIVAGSSNVDMTALMKTLPRPGETIGGATLIQANGGKGANQAVTAGRLGADITFLTCVGDDDHGRMLEKTYAEDGIDTSAMKFVKDVPTGVALIYVDAEGENCIAVAPGANNKLLPEDILKAEAIFENADYLLIQLEIPMETVEAAVSLASDKGVKVILNPAPMNDIKDSTLDGLYLITPNETEAEKLTGIHIDNEEDAHRASLALFEKGVRNVIITLGSNGSLVCTPDSTTLIHTRKVKAVDTTAAGDVYNGALVTALAEGESLEDAARFATAAAAISVTRAGAQTSIPYRNEL